MGCIDQRQNSAVAEISQTNHLAANLVVEPENKLPASVGRQKYMPLAGRRFHSGIIHIHAANFSNWRLVRFKGKSVHPIATRQLATSAPTCFQTYGIAMSATS